MKTYYCAVKMSIQARKAIENVIATNEKYSNSHFFKPGCTSGTRRGNEERFRKENSSFLLKNSFHDIKVIPYYSETCNKVYYSLCVTVNGEKKDIRVLKKLLLIK